MTIELFHSTSTKTAEELLTTRFAGLFCTDSEQNRYGDYCYVCEVEDSKIVEGCFNGHDYDECLNAIKTVLSDVYNDDYENDYVESIINDDSENAFLDEDGDADYEAISNAFKFTKETLGAPDETWSWEAQRVRGLVAKTLGYDAVQMNDENGTSYLVVNAVFKAVE